MTRCSYAWTQPGSKVTNQASVQRPVLNDILPRLVGIKYLTLIDASSGYHNLKLDEQSSYSTTFSCPFRGYRYMQLPCGVAPAGDMFQKKIDKLSQDYLMYLALLMTF